MWAFPLKKININSCFNLHWIDLHSIAKLFQSYPTLCNPMDCSPPASCVHGISRQEYQSGLPCSPPGIFPTQCWTCVSSISCTGSWIFTASATWEALSSLSVCRYMERDHWAKLLPERPQRTDRRPHLGFSEMPQYTGHTQWAKGAVNGHVLCSATYSLLLPLALPPSVAWLPASGLSVQMASLSCIYPGMSWMGMNLSRPTSQQASCKVCQQTSHLRGLRIQRQESAK